MATRRERERSELRRRILAATRTLLVEGGREAVTMREVARRVEYSPAALYQHFPDKEALIHELCMTDFAELAAAFLAVSRQRGPLATLCRVGLAYLGFARAYPEHYRFMFMTPNVGTPPDSTEQRADPTVNAYVLVHDLVDHAIAAGELREELSDSHLVAQTVWAGVHGVAALDVCRRDAEAWVDFREFEARAGALVRTVVLGIARDAEYAEDTLRAVFAESRVASAEGEQR